MIGSYSAFRKVLCFFWRYQRLASFFLAVSSFFSFLRQSLWSDVSLWILGFQLWRYRVIFTILVFTNKLRYHSVFDAGVLMPLTFFKKWPFAFAHFKRIMFVKYLDLHYLWTLYYLRHFSDYSSYFVESSIDISIGYIGEFFFLPLDGW